MAGPSPELRTNIDDTVHQMRENINKVSQRGERLDDIQLKADRLASSAGLYRRGANKIRKQMRRSMWTACFVFGGIVILAAVIAVVVVLRMRK